MADEAVDEIEMGLCKLSCHAAGKFLVHLVHSVDFEKFLFNLHHGIFLKMFREMWACPGPAGRKALGRVAVFHAWGGA